MRRSLPCHSGGSPWQRRDLAALWSQVAVNRGGWDPLWTEARGLFRPVKNVAHTCRHITYHQNNVPDKWENWERQTYSFQTSKKFRLPLFYKYMSTDTDHLKMNHQTLQKVAQAPKKVPICTKTKMSISDQQLLVLHVQQEHIYRRHHALWYILAE